MRNVANEQLPIELEPLESARARFGEALRVPVNIDVMTDEEAARGWKHMDRRHVFDLHVAGVEARYMFTRDILEGKQFFHFTCSPNPQHLTVDGNEWAVVNLMFAALYELTGAKFGPIHVTIAKKARSIQVLFEWSLFQRARIVAKAGDN